LAEGLRPDPLGELTALSRPLIWTKGVSLPGRGKGGGKGRGGGREGRTEGEGRREGGW